MNRINGDQTERVEVTIGLRDASQTEITSGLKEGERVSTAQAFDDGLDFTQGPPEEVRRGGR